MARNISVADKRWTELNGLKQPGDSFDDVVERLLNRPESKRYGVQTDTHPDEWDNPTLEDALDGLYAAHVWCLEEDNTDLASAVFDHYQTVAEMADWDPEPKRRELDNE